MVGFPNKPMGFPTKNDEHLGCEMGVPPFKETTHQEWYTPLKLTCSAPFQEAHPQKETKFVVFQASIFRGYVCLFQGGYRWMHLVV